MKKQPYRHPTTNQPRPQPPTFKVSDPVPIHPRAAHRCDCGQPALWQAWLTIGRATRPAMYYLCDDCLSLELAPPAAHDEP